MIQRISELERLVKKEPIQSEVLKTNEEEYDKNWIVHRQIRKVGNEVFIVDWKNHQGEWHIENECNQVIHYNTTIYQKSAERFTRAHAIAIRDTLNKERIGRRFLWVVRRIND